METLPLVSATQDPTGDLHTWHLAVPGAGHPVLLALQVLLHQETSSPPRRPVVLTNTLLIKSLMEVSNVKGTLQKNFTAPGKGPIFIDFGRKI